MKKLILASSSPRRQEILNMLGVPFEIIPSDADEDLANRTGLPHEVAAEISLLKAQSVASSLKSGLVIGADTVVALDDKIYGKPCSYDEGYKMLESLSGRHHFVITGFTVVDVESSSYISSYEKTKVSLCPLPDQSIRAYLDSGEYKDKAGAYAIQNRFGLFVKGIEGCYFNVVGLPIYKLSLVLQNFGYDFSSFWAKTPLT